MLTKIFTLVILVFSFSSYGQTSVDELFSQGLKSYQGSNFEEAEKIFQQALVLQSDNASLLYNLGLTEYRLGKAGPAIASWRRALALNPSLSDARDAISFASSKLEIKELPHQVMLLETIRHSYLQWVSLNQMLFLFAVCLFATCWVAIKYLGLKKRALDSETSSPAIPLNLYILTAAFLATAFLSGAKVLDSFKTRATVLPKKIEVRAGPDVEQAALFDLYEGLEVLLDDVQNDWVKVTYPGGRSGWVPSTAIKETK